MSKRGGRGVGRGTMAAPIRGQCQAWIMGQAHRGCSKASGAGLRSDRTVHRYIGDLARAAEFIEQQFGVGRLARISHEQAQHYIDSRRAEGLHAATLQGYAKALETLPRVGRLSVPSRRTERLAQHSRAYTDDQVRLVQSRLTPSAQLAITVLLESGCRVADLASLCPAAERPLQNARVERLLPNRFLGRDNWPRFTIIGKGGHEYLSCVRPETAARLAAVRLEVPRAFYNRDVEHATVQLFDLPAGNRLSQQWTRASQYALGYSHGIHGLRHSFAQDRVQELLASGMPWTMALECTSQMMGHYRPEEIQTYLR